MSSLHPVLVFSHRQFIEETTQTDLAELLALKDSFMLLSGTVSPLLKNYFAHGSSI